jgi:hypothetical protein
MALAYVRVGEIVAKLVNKLVGIKLVLQDHGGG